MESDDSKQNTADMTAFVQNLLQQMYFLFLSSFLASYFLNIYSLDEMGSRINDLEQSVNDLKAELDEDDSQPPLIPRKSSPGDSGESEITDA